MDDYLALDALGQAELVRKKEITALELVDAAIRRIEGLNPKINAVVTPLFDQAREIARGKKYPDGPFAGVPFLLKDLLVSLRGVRKTSGCRVLANYVPDYDSEVVARFKNAGLIILGKTNTPELGIQPVTEPRLFGPTRNPWDLGKTAGGSSGGAAAAVASGMVALAHGNDGGGSIRIPASCCGVFGLKPTRGRVTLAPDFGDIQNGMVVEHALTRTVRDSAALLDAIQGPAPGDPYWAAPPPKPYLQEITVPPSGLKVALTAKAPNGVPIHPDCLAALNETAKLLKDLGHHVEEKDFDIDGPALGHSFVVVWTGGVVRSVQDSSRMAGRTPAKEDFETLTWGLYELGLKQSAGAYLEAIRQFQLTSRRIARQMMEIDIWLTPTLGLPPIPIGALDSPPEDPLRGFFAAAEFVPFTSIANVTGQPAMSVPLYWNRNGLPIGSHFLGRYGDEATLFRLAVQLESARPWSSRQPPVVTTIF